MKHLLNNLTEEEKTAIREQHTGGMKVMNENFSKLVNTKLGDVNPMVNEQYSDDGQLDVSELAKKIVLSKKYSEIVDEIQPTDYSDEFEFGDNFISNLLDEYFDEEYYDDLYDVVKMEYGDIILDLYGSSEE